MRSSWAEFGSWRDDPSLHRRSRHQPRTSSQSHSCIAFHPSIRCRSIRSAAHRCRLSCRCRRSLHPQRLRRDRCCVVSTDTAQAVTAVAALGQLRLLGRVLEHELATRGLHPTTRSSMTRKEMGVSGAARHDGPSPEFDRAGAAHPPPVRPMIHVLAHCVTAGAEGVTTAVGKALHHFDRSDRYGIRRRWTDAGATAAAGNKGR